MSDITTLLGGLSAEQFLSEYWQKKPLLVRHALPGFHCPVTPEELAGLTCEEEVESRLILEKDGKTPWELRHGPFSEEDFLALPDSHWTVLIQEINKHIPEFALLQDRFGFIPNWRLDDVMVSFAQDQGTVGPHADNYDVFLVQGPGRRRWQISHQEAGPEQLLPGLPLRIMRDFRPEEEWILEEGDMLYLPPGVCHHGVALGDCITISVGFRAPAIAELLAAYCADTVGRIDTERFYGDPGLKTQANPGLISPAALNDIRALIHSLPREDAEIDRWFASFITDVHPGHHLPEPEEPLEAEALRSLIEAEGGLWRSEYARFGYLDEDGGVQLFVAGEAFTLDAELAFAAPLLAGQRYYPLDSLRSGLEIPGFLELLTALYNLGALYLPRDVDEHA